LGAGKYGGRVRENFRLFAAAGFADCDSVPPYYAVGLGVVTIAEVNSYTFHAQGRADGREHVPMWIGKEMAWWGDHNETPEGSFIIQGSGLPEHDLWVIGAALSMRYVNLPPESIAASWAMAGIAGSGGDYVVPMLSGSGTQTIMFPPGYAMRLPYGDLEHNHLDFHVYCPQFEHGLFFGHLTIWTVH
jgi:hypothetical protein